VLALIVFIGYQCSKPGKPKPPPTEKVQRVSYAEIGPLVDRVRGILYDVDADGVLNCVDFAVTFKKVCPSARIIRNENSATGFNHLFNKVWTGSTWVTLEPQGSSYMYNMDIYWGSQYQSAFDVDETEFWERYVR
jgi:hypothetical protein